MASIDKRERAGWEWEYVIGGRDGRVVFKSVKRYATEAEAREAAEEVIAHAETVTPDARLRTTFAVRQTRVEG